MIFFVSTHFKHKIVCWFVWHYTTASATPLIDHYANTNTNTNTRYYYYQTRMIVPWFVWHNTLVSATSRMDHYANTFRVRSGACQERANVKDGIGRIWRGAIGRWLLVSKPNVFSIPGQALGDFASKIKLTPVLLVLSHFRCFWSNEKWRHSATIGSQARHSAGLDRSIFSIPPPSHTRLCCA